MRILSTSTVRGSLDVDGFRKFVDQKIDMDLSGALAAEHSAGYIELAASASDIALPFGSVAESTYILLLADDPVTVKLGGVGQIAHPLTPIAAYEDPLSVVQRSEQPGKLEAMISVTSVHLANPSSTAVAKVYYLIIGEAA